MCTSIKFKTQMQQLHSDRIFQTHLFRFVWDVKVYKKINTFAYQYKSEKAEFIQMLLISIKDFKIWYTLYTFKTNFLIWIGTKHSGMISITRQDLIQTHIIVCI